MDIEVGLTKGSDPTGTRLGPAGKLDTRSRKERGDCKVVSVGSLGRVGGLIEKDSRSFGLH